MTDPNRRALLAMLAAAATLAGLPAEAGAAPPKLGPPIPFSWETLQARARALAAQPHRPLATATGASEIDFDTAGTLSYRPDATIAGGIRLFPVGRYAPAPVRISIVEGTAARAVSFSPDMFTSSGKARALGMVGFRAMAKGGTSDWLAYMGASYFRAAGSQDQYGLSARGLAIDTGIAGQEEFPAFTDFWIEHSSEQAYVIYALLDGPSVAGAYRFVSRQSEAGVVQDVSSVLFLRRDIARLGIAPATSMFWYGEAGHPSAGDWRPEIHDSDGLAMWTGAGERIWRPLVNPPRDSTNSFADTDPQGFGLIQRDRAFEHYQDDGAFYDRRPNLWVEPKGKWGKGAVMLYAFPTTGETVDNIVTFWVPDAPARRGAELRFDYRLHWTSHDLSADAAARAVDVWQGVAGRPGDAPIRGAHKVVVDFVGNGLRGLDRSSGVEARIAATGGRILSKAAYPVVGQANRWRVTVDVAPTGGDAVDLRLDLTRRGAALSETFLAQIF